MSGQNIFNVNNSDNPLCSDQSKRRFAYLGCYTDWPVIAGSQSPVRLCELCKVLLPTLEQVGAKTCVDNLVKVSESSNVRQPCDVNSSRVLAKLKFQTVQTLQQFPACIALQLPSLLATNCNVFLQSKNKYAAQED